LAELVSATVGGAGVGVTWGWLLARLRPTRLRTWLAAAGSLALLGIVASLIAGGAAIPAFGAGVTAGALGQGIFLYLVGVRSRAA